MNKTMYLFLAVCASLAFLSFHSGKITQKIDLNKSTLSWMATKVTGKHHGMISLKSGELEFEESRLAGGTFEIDMTSITDLDLTGESHDKLINHLKSEDFFSTVKYPTAKFQITKAIQQGKELYKIIGDLTIKGITKQIRFDATIKGENGLMTADASIKIDRADFDIKYRSGSFFENLGDKTIYDEFDLQVQLVTAK